MAPEEYATRILAAPKSTTPLLQELAKNYLLLKERKNRSITQAYFMGALIGTIISGWVIIIFSLILWYNMR
jgi:hypothetical protein